MALLNEEILYENSMERQQDPFKIVVLGEGELRVRVNAVWDSLVILSHKHGGDSVLLTILFANSESG